MIVTSVWLNERVRIINCQGCRHLGVVGSCGCCNYYLNTNHRRPNPFGVENCAARDLEDDAKTIEAAKRETLRDKAAHDRRVEDRRPKWDIVLAESMYRDGKTFKEIAAAVNRGEDCVYRYAKSHNWKREVYVRGVKR